MSCGKFDRDEFEVRLSRFAKQFAVWFATRRYQTTPFSCSSVISSGVRASAALGRPIPLHEQQHHVPTCDASARGRADRERPLPPATSTSCFGSRRGALRPTSGHKGAPRSRWSSGNAGCNRIGYPLDQAKALAEQAPPAVPETGAEHNQNGCADSNWNRREGRAGSWP